MTAASPPAGEELLAWIRLIRTDGIGPVHFFGLLARCGSARAALDALPDLSRGRRLKPADRATAEAELDHIERIGAELVAVGDARFPQLLPEISDCPPYLIVRGNPDRLAEPAAGIVGARNASLNGRKMAKVLGTGLADAGITVWSGLARGIDTAAHEGALTGSTVAVLAGGTDVIYPKENRALYEKIIETGAVVSEMPPGTEPQARHFPRRNRIISGASAGVVVVEGTPKSGSLITARFALDQGREVFAVPGSPLDPRAHGPNGLIREGALLVQSAADVLAELGRPGLTPVKNLPDTSGQSQPTDKIGESEINAARVAIEEALGPAPVTVDELRRQCQVSAPVLAAVLLDLELEGRLERLPGNRVAASGSV